MFFCSAEVVCGAGYISGAKRRTVKGNRNFHKLSFVERCFGNVLRSVAWKLELIDNYVVNNSMINNLSTYTKDISVRQYCIFLPLTQSSVEEETCLSRSPFLLE